MIIDRLHDSLGAVVWDVDLSKPLGFCDRSTLYDAWLAHVDKV